MIVFLSCLWWLDQYYGALTNPLHKDYWASLMRNLEYSDLWHFKRETVRKMLHILRTKKRWLAYMVPTLVIPVADHER